ncbi:hypothetical protein ONA92_21930 [Mycobacteroides salmoniphilum]|uniref:hypothetical protein n=1 Tax=Mycobacteroides salmoniphilum TaxID=404941 RepID=UPI003566A1EB
MWRLLNRPGEDYMFALGPMSPLLNSPDDFMFAGAFLFLSTAVVWAVITGRLVPKGTVDKIVTSKDDEIKFLREATGKLAGAVDKYAAPAQLAVRAIESMQERP